MAQVNIQGTKRKEDPNFEVTKMRNRRYLVVHRETGRVFECIGHPNIHKWWSDEIVGKKRYQTVIEDWGSMKGLLVSIDRWIRNTKKQIPEKKIYVPVERPEIPFPTYIGPEGKPVQLRIEQISEARCEYTSEDGRHFIIERKSKFKKGYVWSVRENFEGRHYITDEAESLQAAGKALQTYLDTRPIKYIPVTADCTVNIIERADGMWKFETTLDSNGEVLFATVLETVEVADMIYVEEENLKRQGYNYKFVKSDYNPLESGV